MSWEDRFSTMVKESSIKIDEAKRRLHSFDHSRVPTLKEGNTLSVVSPPAFHSTPQTGANQAASLHTTRTHGLDDSLFISCGCSSVALLHTLYEKIEQQSQGFDLLKSKVHTLETKLNNQQSEMQQFKERLSQLVQKVEDFKLETCGTALEKFKTEVVCELNEMRNCKTDTKDDNDRSEWKTTTRERLGHTVKESGQVVSSLEEIKSRLDRIETDLSSSHDNVENNSKIVERNITLFADWKNENTESMNRLCKLQDLSVDEVKHLRSKLYNVQDKIQEIEKNINDISLHNEFSTNRKSNSFLDHDDLNPKVKPQSYISISSDEEESLTNSSVNLDASDSGDLSLEIDDLNLDGNDSRRRAKSQSCASDLLNSSLNSLTGSEDSLSEI